LTRDLAAAEEGDGEGRTRPPREAAWIGTPVALLMLLTPDFWVHPSMIMIESLGMLATVAALLAHAVVSKRPSPRGFFAVGALAALTFLAKYNYGFPLIVALALSALLARRAVRPRHRDVAALLAGFVGPVALWLAYPFPDKLRGLYGFSVNRDEGLTGLDNLLFYPSRIADMVSWPVAIALLVAAVLALRRARDGRTSAAPLFPRSSLVMLTAHPNKQLRYVFTVLPVMYVLGELELCRLLRRWLPEAARVIVWPVVLVLLAGNLDPRPALRAERAHAQPLRSASAIMEFVASQVRPESPTLVLGSRGQRPHLLPQSQRLTPH